MNINKKIIAKEIQGETVLLNKENGDYFSLNNSGTDIYNCICNGMNADEIVNFMLDKYDAEFDTIKKDVMMILKQLEEKNILLKKQ